MPFDGNGTFVRLYNWANDALAGIKIQAIRQDAEANGFATGLSNCITRDGQGKPTAPMNWNGQTLSGVSTLSASAVSATTVTASTPIGIPSGGTGANTQIAALAALLGTSAIPIANGVTGATTAETALTALLAGEGGVLTQAHGGTGYTSLASAFTSAFSNNGYLTLPNGIIIQWETTGPIAANSGQSIFWPETFPNACFFALPSLYSATASTGGAGVYGYAQNGVTVYNRSTVTSQIAVLGIGN